jgi:hypothetical protein
MNAIIVMDNRAKPSSTVPTDDEKIKLFGMIIAYAVLIPQIAIKSSISRYRLEAKLGQVGQEPSKCGFTSSMVTR